MNDNPHIVMYVMYWPENRTIIPQVEGVYPSYAAAKDRVGTMNGYTIVELKPGKLTEEYFLNMQKRIV